MTIFYHPDGKPCSVLNKLGLTSDYLNGQDVHLNKVIREAKSVFEKIRDPLVYSGSTNYRPLVMPNLMAGVLALLPWILMAIAVVGGVAYSMRKRYASSLLA